MSHLADLFGIVREPATMLRNNTELSIFEPPPCLLSMRPACYRVFFFDFEGGLFQN
jgi:hypothetical protein